MRTFGDETPIPILWGRPRLSLFHVRRMLARRAAWLTKRAEEHAQRDEPHGLYLDELAAIQQAIEVYEQQYPATAPAKSA